MALVAPDPGNTNIITASADKETKSTLTGIFVTAKHDVVIVKGLAQNSIFQRTALKQGLEIIAINNVPTRGKTAQEVAHLIHDAEGTLVISAKDTQMGRLVAKEIASKPSGDATQLHSAVPAVQVVGSIGRTGISKPRGDGTQQHSAVRPVQEVKSIDRAVIVPIPDVEAIQEAGDGSDCCCCECDCDIS